MLHSYMEEYTKDQGLIRKLGEDSRDLQMIGMLRILQEELGDIAPEIFVHYGEKDFRNVTERGRAEVNKEIENLDTACLENNCVYHVKHKGFKGYEPKIIKNRIKEVLKRKGIDVVGGEDHNQKP